MNKTLWQWSVAQDDWVYVTTATEDKLKVVARGYKRRSRPGTKFRWTDGIKPKKFRTRAKKG